ncbi:PREDICTED: AT-rich interactive [Prunus dulcis]|uniref:PREDICTED: AT-rich interactive n=1 Tax=Prunus dulcis TaxID=3755 RepID=A0A5E4FQE1_PRUDU|nr:PREDICTED: AT-rich interactive [Prunus dulcis]
MVVSLSLVSIFIGKGKMINKRPFGGEDSYEVACKHPRQLEHSNEDIFPFNGAPQKFQISDGEGDGDGDGSFSKCPDEGRFASVLGTSVSNDTYKELETGASGSFARFLWSNSSIIEANVRPEAASHLSLFPEFFAPVNQWRALLHSDKICSSPVDYPPRKLVSIGAQHQAHVPVWGFEGSHASVHLEKLDPQHEPSCTSSQDLVLDVNEEKLMGTRVISMPDLEASAANYFSEDVGARSNCKCGDAGSVRCVRQHVMETREKLKEDLGEHLFEELGFYEMGEGVADKWTKEEEHAFHDVVLSNPVSLGKNFWHHLSVAFPSRTHKDLVSYYFNVFMLRKRTEQNRFDPLNIDSDDDEWQKSELGTVEDDEDSGVESPVNLDASAYNQEEHLEGCYEHIEDAYDVDGCRDGNDVVDCILMKDKDGGDIDDGSGAHVGSSPGDSGGTETQILDKIASNNREHYDIQDDSCTSYEYQRDS